MWWRLMVVAGVLAWPLVVQAAPVEVVYPARYGAQMGRDDYPLAVLKLAMEKSGRDYNLRPASREMTQTRLMLDLELGGEITVAWVGTSAVYERRFLPVRVPIYRGLLGYRLFIIHKDNQRLFDRVTSLTRLANFRAGQGTGWADIEILENAGLIVHAAPYDSLINMLSHRRIDYFPRGVNEAFPELAAQKAEHADLRVEENLLLVYPFALFFFVNRDNRPLAAAIRSGLERAYDDGSFLSLFNSHPHIQSILDRADLDRRRRFDVPNPLLSEETRAIPDRYWFRR